MLQVGRGLKRITTLEPPQHEGEARDFSSLFVPGVHENKSAFSACRPAFPGPQYPFPRESVDPNADIVVADVTSSL